MYAHSNLVAVTRKIAKRAILIFMSPGMVLKWRQISPLLATIRNDLTAMKILALISLLALLAITGAVYTDLVLTSEQAITQHSN